MLNLINSPWGMSASQPGTDLGRDAWQAPIFGGLAATTVGLVALLWPGATLATVGLFFGVYLLTHGVMQLVAAFTGDRHGSTKALIAVSGALSVALGLLCFQGPFQSAWLLAVWIGFGWLLRGVALAVSSITTGIPTPGWSLSLGLLSAFAGLGVVAWPFSSVATLTLVTGLWLLVLGATEVVHGVRLRRHSDAS